MEPILIGTTDRSVLVFIPDPASTTGAGKTGLNAAALTVTYTRVETDNDVVHADVTSSLNDLSALTDAHNDWGLKEVSSTLSKGLYRFDIADAVFASGAWYAVVQITITSGTAAATPLGFRLVAYNERDATRLGLAALPNADASASGGLLTFGTGTGQLNVSGGLASSNVLKINDSTQAASGAETTFEYYETNFFLPAVALVDDVSNIVTTGAITTSGGAVSNVTTTTTTTNLTNDPPGVTTLLSRIPSALFAGITSLAQWLGLIAGKQTGNSTARTEIRATGAGSGTFDETTDSTEAIRDRGDAAWITATGFSTHSAADVWAVATRELSGTINSFDELNTSLNSAHGPGSWATATGFSTLDAADIRTAVGLASANLDTQLLKIDNLPNAAIVHTAGKLHILNEGGNPVASEAVQNEVHNVTEDLNEMFEDDPDNAGKHRFTEGALANCGAGEAGIGTGNGDIAVSHNYGGVDALRVLEQDTNDPIDDALITALVGGTINAQTRTGSDGRWGADLMLDAGSYTINVSKAGVIEAYSFTLAVVEP